MPLELACINKEKYHIIEWFWLFSFFWKVEQKYIHSLYLCCFANLFFNLVLYHECFSSLSFHFFGKYLKWLTKCLTYRWTIFFFNIVVLDNFVSKFLHNKEHYNKYFCMVSFDGPWYPLTKCFPEKLYKQKLSLVFH